MAKNNKMPAIRFSGYTDAWEQRKLSEVVTINPKTELPDKFKYVDLESVVGTNLLGFQVIKKENAPSRAQRLASYGDVFYQTVRPYQRNNYLFENIDKDMVFSTGYAQLRSKLDSYFLLTLVQNDNFVKVVLDNCTGTSYPAINGSELGKITVQIPSNDEEANQIGKVFRGIDNIITLHQRKLEKLKLIKQALLQKLFPQHGSNIPELRFKGFTDAWEQCKLGEIFEYLQNNTLSRDSLNYKNPNIKNIHYGDILVKFDEILDGSNKDIPYINSDLDLSKFSKSLLKDGDIIFSDTAEDDTVGKAIELQNVNAPFILSGLHTIPCRPLIPFGKGYLGNFLNSDSYRMQLRPLVQGIKVSSISKSALKDTMIEYPKNLDEQEKIGSLFQNIAKMITLHQRKLDMLKNVKKGLLQKMFV